MTHGGIDGYSRLIVFLNCSDNNRADTVNELFQEAIRKYGLPSRVRGDHGGENVLVRECMESDPPVGRGPDRGSFLSGRSVHNTRIERLWRDVFYSVIQTYYGLFYHLESQGLLDVDSDIDLFVLKLVYLPVINEALLEFKQAYNNHKVRTEGNKTPVQMYGTGCLPDNPQLDMESLDPLYGIDPNAPPPHDIALSIVDVPATISPLLTDEQRQVLYQSFQDLSEDTFHQDKYCNLRTIVSEMVRAGPPEP